MLSGNPKGAANGGFSPTAVLCWCSNSKLAKLEEKDSLRKG